MLLRASCASLFALLVSAAQISGFGQSAQPAPPQNITSGEEGKIVVPADTRIPLELLNAIGTRTAYVGQEVYFESIYPVTVKNRIIIPPGTYVKGRITQVVRPGHVKGKGVLGLRFDSLTLENGVTHSLSAVLSGLGTGGKESFNAKESKVIGEGTKAKDAETILISGAEGAGIGSIAGVSARRTGEGAAVGGAAGALGGLVWVLATRGKDIALPKGTNFELQLTRPITFYPDELVTPQSYPSGPAFPRREPGPG